MGAGEHDKRMNQRWSDMFWLLPLTIAVCLFYHTSPTNGDFWWSDAPRHAMDGAFYYDMARALPLKHLKQWAIDYYLQYPAVTALTYPPLFALVEAVFFGILGISHATAQLTVTVFLLLAAYGAFFLARMWMSGAAAFATALLFIATPVMALWGRQVMLEVPTFAFLLWSAYCLFRYIGSPRPLYLYLTVVLILAATYTKQPAIFILPCYLVTLWSVDGKALLRRAEFWWSFALFACAIVPLVVYTWLWGRANMQQAIGGGWVKHSRISGATWTYIAGFEWPRQVGWVVLALGLLFTVGAFIREEWQPPKPAFLFLWTWLGTGYIFFTSIAVSSQRYTIFLIFPLITFAVLALIRVLPHGVGTWIAVVVAAATLAHTLRTNHVPYVTGYQAAAEYVCSNAPPDSVVMFSGLRDGSFIFNVRSRPECKNLTVIRADKLLLRVAIDRRLFGVQEYGISEVKFKDMLQRYGVRYIVIEPDFWADLKSMQMLVGVLHESQFRLMTKVPVTSNREHIKSDLEIYENLGPVSQGKNVLRVELPVSGIAVEGSVGQNR